MENKTMNVVNLEVPRQNREETNSAAPSRDVLESMYEGVAMSKWGSLENLAKEVADRTPMEYLKLLARLVEKDSNS
jgi:hypothetical protein